MELRETKTSGCYELLPRILEDKRGYFVKTFHEYFSLSHQGVINQKCLACMICAIYLFYLLGLEYNLTLCL